MWGFSVVFFFFPPSRGGKVQDKSFGFCPVFQLKFLTGWNSTLFLEMRLHHNRFHCQEIPLHPNTQITCSFCVLYPTFPNNNSVTRLIQFILFLACLKKLNLTVKSVKSHLVVNSVIIVKNIILRKVLTIYEEKIPEAALGSICIFQMLNPYCL